MNPNRCGHWAVDRSVGSGPGLLGCESSLAPSPCDISVPQPLVFAGRSRAPARRTAEATASGGSQALCTGRDTETPAPGGYSQLRHLLVFQS